MNFLAPWFLLGAAAVAGPVLFHLIRRSARERASFSSLLFLRPTPPRATRRRKLEDLLLLALRCLGLLLLAAGFARPLFPDSNATPPPAAAGHETVILLDTSASMRRERLWEKACAAAAHYIDTAELGDRVAVLTFDRQPRTLIGFAEWDSWPLTQRATLARQRLETVSPGWRGTQLGLALTTAAETFPDDARHAGEAAARTVALISDLQEGAKLDGLQGHDWPRGVRVILERVEAKRRGNAGLEILDSAASENLRQARVRVSNSRDSEGEKFQIGWDGGAMAPAYVPPGQTRTLLAPELSASAPTGILRLTGDAEDFDNTSWFVASEMEDVSVAYFGGESANDPAQLRYYLQRAFPDTARRRVAVVPAISNGVSAAGVLERAALAVIPSSLGADDLAAVRAWVSNGATALIVLTNTAAGPTLAALAAAPDLEVTEAPGEYALLGDVDFAHPIFAAFTDPRFSDFSRIHFWKHRRWTAPPSLGARALAKFDDGATALAQIPVGKGNLLVLASGWAPADSQLALSTKFLPLLQTILDWAGAAAPARAQFETGDALPAPSAAGPALEWRKPDGKMVALAAGAAFTETETPGIYTVTAGGKLRRFAVNLPLDESRTAPLSPDDFARLGVPLQNAAGAKAALTPTTQRQALQAETEGRQKIWRWLVAALLAVALVEVACGGWLARRAPRQEAVS